MNQDQNATSITPGGRQPLPQGDKGAIQAVNGPPGQPSVPMPGQTMPNHTGTYSSGKK